MTYKNMLIMGISLSVFTGCAGNSVTAFAPAESSLYITSEGTVTSATVETYEKEYYNADELKASVEEVLTDFNETAGGEEAVVKVKECTMENGTAKLLLDFEDAGTYLGFMEQYPDEESPIQLKNLDITTVADGIGKGYLVGETFTKFSDSEKSVTSDEIAKQSKLYVAAVEGASLIQPDGVIQYISSGITAVGENMVETPEDHMSYIVFK